MLLHIIILAGGEGKRMHSRIPKVLHCIAGQPMLRHVLDTAYALNPSGVHIIYGHEGEKVKKSFSHTDINWVFQEKQLGTGHAVLQALPFIPPEATVLILSGDVPLIQKSTLESLLTHQHGDALALLLARLENPAGLGRIKRDQEGSIRRIVEEKDASPEEKSIKEIYSGICAAKAKSFNHWLPKLSQNNAQGEFYLTDIIALAVRDGISVNSLLCEDPFEIQGVNNRSQLQILERNWQRRTAQQLLLSGVSLADATRIDVRGQLKCDQDVFIDVNCVFSGNVNLGEGCVIEPNCILKNVTLGKNCHILANSVLEDCQIADDCHIGPFARLRPGTVLARGCKIGNFVETKQAIFGESSKASHLSYLGDVVLGRDVNIGAGTITCNYDGANKHQTRIGDNVFVGSDTQFVAPVSIGAHATIGAGSTIRKDVPPNELTLTISQQKTVSGWKRPKKSTPADAKDKRET